MSVKQRTTKSGKIVYDIRIQYEGIRISRTVRTTMTEAKRVESKILQDLIHGNFDILTNEEDPRFNVYADEYLKVAKELRKDRNQRTKSKKILLTKKAY